MSVVPELTKYFTDRDDHLRVFDDLWDSDTAWILCYYGRSGVGKSALLDYIYQTRCGEDSRRVWGFKLDFARPFPLSGSVSILPLNEHLPSLIHEFIDRLSKIDFYTVQQYTELLKKSTPTTLIVKQSVFSRGDASAENITLNAILDRSLYENISLVSVNGQILQLAQRLKFKKRVAIMFDHYELLHHKRNDTFNWIWAILDALHRQFPQIRIILASNYAPPQIDHMRFKHQIRTVKLDPFLSEDIKECVQKLTEERFSVTELNIAKVEFFTYGFPNWLYSLVEGNYYQKEGDEVGFSLSILRKVHHEGKERRRYVIRNLREPLAVLLEWASLLRRFDLQFLQEQLNVGFLSSIGKSEFPVVGIDTFFELADWGFEKGLDNFLRSPRNERKLQHLLQAQANKLSADLFYQNARLLCTRRQDVDEGFLLDALYYEFMYSPITAFETWRSALDRAKDSNQSDLCDELISLAEEAEFVLEDSMMAEVFQERSKHAEQNGQIRKAEIFMLFAQSLFAAGKSPLRENLAIRGIESRISERQNQHEFLQLLAAQRQIYDEEKKRTAQWIWSVMSLGILGVIIATEVKVNAPFFTLALLFLVVIELSILGLIRNRHGLAVRIQEHFDTDLFQLEWNKALAGNKPEAIFVTSLALRFKRKQSEEEWELLRDWYLTEYRVLPLHQARIACQRQNVRWEKEIRIATAKICAGLTFLLTLLVVGVFGHLINWQIVEFLNSPALLFIPILLFGLMTAVNNWRIGIRNERLYEFSKDLWEESRRDDADLEAVKRRTRELQDQIFRNRKDDSPIFNWLYSMLENRYAIADQLPDGSTEF